MTNRRTQTILLTLSATALGLVGILGLTGFSLGSPAVQTKPPTWPTSGSYSIDAVHSGVLFRVKHLDTSWFFGRFNSISGDVQFDEKSPEKCSVQVSIEMDSIDTANKKRDEHLKSPDFFDAVQFPTATFTSQAVKRTSDGKYTLTGDLELHGVTKPITMNFEVVGFSDTKMGVRGGFYGTFSIKRSEYGISLLPTGIGEDVEITVSLETRQTESKR